MTMVGAAAMQLQRSRRVSTAVHMSSLLSIKERQQVVRWSEQGGLAQVPESMGQSRRWLEASPTHRDLIWGGVPRAMRIQLYLRCSGMTKIRDGASALEHQRETERQRHRQGKRKIECVCVCVCARSNSFAFVETFRMQGLLGLAGPQVSPRACTQVFSSHLFD